MVFLRTISHVWKFGRYDETGLQLKGGNYDGLIQSVSARK